MAAVAITINKRKKLEDNRLIVDAKLIFGDGSATYPSGGVAVAGKNLGCPTFVDALLFSDPSSATKYILKYDQVNQKVRVYVPDTGAELSGTIPAMTTYVQVTGR